MRPVALAVALLALAACERGKNVERAEPAAPANEAREVAAADAYGAPGDAVADVAFWTHPTVNFEGRLLATAGNALVAYDIETGERSETARIDGPAGEIAVFYDGEGAAAQGYALVGGRSEYALFSIDNDGGALSPVTTAMPNEAAARFCVGRRDGAAVIYEVGDDALAARKIALNPDGGAFIGDVEPFADFDGVKFCHVDDRTGAVIAIGDDGAIRRIDPDTGESFGLAMIEGLIADSTAILLSTAVGDEPKSGGAIAILDGMSGVIRLLDLTDGHALGMVRVKSTFDLEAVSSATAIAAGYGNYGGVYRNGALVVVAAAGDAAPIRLVPWNGVLSALQLPLGETVDPRAPSPAEEDDGVIDIEFVDP
jgi:hypothetical protein